MKYIENYFMKEYALNLYDKLHMYSSKKIVVILFILNYMELNLA